MFIIRILSEICGIVAGIFIITKLLIKNNLVNIESNLALLRAEMDKRLSVLEKQTELFWDSIKPVITQTLIGKAPHNPVTEERWKYLLNRFDSNTLTMNEAVELRHAFQEREKKAQEEKDFLTLLSLGLGLALLAVIIGSKE